MLDRHLLKGRHSFSLVELLIVIAIFAVLVSLLMPTLKGTLYISKNLQCLNNLKNITTGTIIYTDDHNGLYPERMSGRDNHMISRGFYNTLEDLSPYIADLTDLTWVCSLYEPTDFKVKDFHQQRVNNFSTYRDCENGGWYGCEDHGVDHLPRTLNKNSRITYSFFGGMEASRKGYGSTWAPYRTRKYLETPFELTNDDGETVTPLTLMWADYFGCLDDGGRSGQPRFQNYQAFHKPREGEAIWNYWDMTNGSATKKQQGREQGRLSVLGDMKLNYSFTDGSVRIIEIPFMGSWWDWRNRAKFNDRFYFVSTYFAANTFGVFPVEEFSEN